MSENVYDALSLSLAFVNIFVMMANFLLKRDAQRGMYPIVFVITKVMLLPTITLAYCLMTKEIKRSVLEFSFFCWLGDIVLLIDSISYTVIGGFSFAAGHLIMIKSFDVKFTDFPIWGILLMVPSLYFHYGVMVPKVNFRLPESTLMVLYITLLEFALAHTICKLRYVSITDFRFLTCFIGYEFFIVSDSLLLMVELKLSRNMCRVGIMGTYFVAVALLILGAID